MSEFKFENLEFEPHHADVTGICARVFFANGYGASVIKTNFSYGNNNGLYELGILKGNMDKWGLTYESGITNDVLGYLSENDVTKYLNQIAALEVVK